MKKRVNKDRKLFLLIVCILILSFSRPLYGKAAHVENIGNLFGMKERLVCMQQDVIFLNDEIEQLRQECEK